MRKLLSPYGIILLTLITIFNNACSKYEALLSYDLIGDWKVTSFKDHKTSTVITKTNDNTWNQYNNGDITVSFIKNDSTSGLISGKKVTNSFSASYTIDPSGKIKISNILQTEINEPEWGRLFDSFSKAETYEVRDNQLWIFYNQGNNTITFARLVR